MRDVLVLLVHLVITTVRLMRPGGIRSIVAGLCAGLIRPARLLRTAIVLRPATILKFHRSLVKRKNPRFGYQRIADQLSLAFGTTIDKDTVRRVLASYYRPDPGSGGPSWLSFLGHAKDSLWSVDLFRCESLILNTHWVMVVMDRCARRIIGFAGRKGTLDGPAVCRMFGRIISGAAPPTYLSSDNDPLFEFHRWKANLRVLEIEEIKTVPYVPRKLSFFQDYYNRERTHQGLGGTNPEHQRGDEVRNTARLDNHRWKSYCLDLYQLPTAA